MRFTPLALGLLICFSSLLIFAPNATATPSVSENFETDTSNTLPSDSWYTSTCSGSGSCRVNPTNPIAGTKSMQISPSTGSMTWTLDATNAFNWCYGGSLTFSILFPTGTTNFAFSFSIPVRATATGSAIGSVGLNIDSGGAITLVSQGFQFSGSTSSSTTVPGLTVAAGTIYTWVFTSTHTCLSSTVFGNDGATLTFFDSANNIFFSTGTAGQLGTANCGGSCSWDGASNVAMDRPTFSRSIGQDLRLDTITFTSNGLSAPTVGAAATISVTNLNGFDVDPFNQVLIARTDIGAGTSKINSYDSNSPTLALRGASPITTACNQADGLMAYSTSANGKQYTGYVNCDGSNIVNDFSIRGGDLNSPDQSGTACSSGSFTCDVDLNGHISFSCQGYALPDGPLQIGNIAAIPISWESGSTGFPAHVQVGFAYSNGANGNIGTWTIRQESGGAGTQTSSCRQEVAFSTPGNTGQICSWRNTIDGNDYIAAIGQANPTKAWQFTIDPYSISSGLHTSLNPIAAGLSAPYDHLYGISCYDNDATVVLAGTAQVARIHIVGGGIGGVVWGPISPPSGGIAGARAVATSRDGKWTAVVGATTTQILNNTNGNLVGTLTTPSGTFREVRMDDTGQTLWIATATSITKYDVHTATTGISVPPGSRGSGSGQVCRNGANVVIPCSGGPTTTNTNTGTVGSGFLGINPGAIDPTGNGSALVGGLFMSILFIIGCACLGAAILPSKEPSAMIWGAGIGAVLGFALTVGMGIMPPTITFILVVIGIGIIGFKIRTNTGSGV